MCAFSGKKKAIWPWTLVAVLMICMTAILEQGAGDQGTLSTQVAQSQKVDNKLSKVIAYLTPQTTHTPKISLRQTFYGVLGFPAFFLQDKPLPFFTWFG